MLREAELEKLSPRVPPKQNVPCIILPDDVLRFQHGMINLTNMTTPVIFLKPL
jgi:hypothetical protein